MSKPKTTHTLETLLAKTIEEGDCMLWTGYHGNKSPMVFHDGKLWMVRKLIVTMQDRVRSGTAFFATKCGNPSCINPDHIAQRTKSEHMSKMGDRANNAASNQIRIAKITATKRAQIAKITAADAAVIRASSESGPVLSERYGIHRTMVNYIKQGRSWKQGVGNPFQGLL